MRYLRYKKLEKREFDQIHEDRHEAKKGDTCNVVWEHILAWLILGHWEPSRIQGLNLDPWIRYSPAVECGSIVKKSFPYEVWPCRMDTTVGSCM